MIHLIGLHIQQQFLEEYAEPLRLAGFEVQATGIVSKFGQLSSGYDGNKGIAGHYKTFRSFLGKYVPAWSDGDMVVLCTWSAGTWSPEYWLKHDPEALELIRVLMVLDGMHSSASSNDGFVAFGKRCMEGNSQLGIFTNTEIKPPYRSTSEAAAIFLDELGVTNRDKPSADGEQWRRADDDGYGHNLYVIDWAKTDSGATAADHVHAVRVQGPQLMASLVTPWLLSLHEAPTVRPSVHDDEPTETLGIRCVDWCRGEMLVDGAGKKPSVDKLKRWFSRAERNGKVGYLGRSFVGNHCAISQSVAAIESARPGEHIPHQVRSSAMELRSDAIANHCWHEVSEVIAKKWFPKPGDLAIYTRAVPGRPETKWWGHVDRVSDEPDVDAMTYLNIGANEVGGAWREQASPFSNPKLLGFIAYPQGGAQAPVDLLDDKQVQEAHELAAFAYTEAGFSA